MALEWLALPDREWVSRNRDLLEAVWDHFEATGEWPDPVEIMRHLRAADPNRRVNSALAEMPQALKREEFAPRRLELTIFGIGCCAEAEPFLRQYLTVAQLALSRFDLPHLPNRLTRAEVTAELGMDERKADRLSTLLMRDAPFLGGGSSGIADWDREIDPRAEEFQGIDDPHALLTFLAIQRRISAAPLQIPPPPLPPPALPEPAIPSPGASESENPQTQLSWLNAGAAIAAIGAFVFVIASSPSPIGLAVFGASALLWLALQYRPQSRFLLVAAVGVGLAAGGVAGSLLAADDNHGPYRYFVASTGKTAVLVARIEPRPQAPMQRETILAQGDSVSVLCLRSENHEAWAKLKNGSFVPADFLTPEVGGKAASPC
jgi:hypothetical protein